jgi:hypothetical protein
MKQSIRVRAARFIWVQALILLGIMASFLLLSCIFFVKNAAHWHLVHIEQDLKVFAAQAARSGEVPRRGDLGAYTFFILDAEGKYLLPRLPQSDENEKLWQEYESKVIYEMQKRREGWSYYPDRGHWDLAHGQYMLRYIYVEKMNWIVAAEGYMPGVTVLLQEMLTPSLFIGMGLIALAAFALMLLNANWHFHRVIRAILRSQENNFIAVDGIPSSPAKDAQPFIKREENLPAAAPDIVIRGSARRSVLSSAPVRPLAEETPVMRPPEPRPVPVERRMPLARQDLRRLDDLGSVSIATTDIRSPVLRRAIEELREEKK